MWDNTVRFSLIFIYVCASKFALILSLPWMLNLFLPLLVEFEARLMAEVVWLHLVATCANHHRPQPDRRSSLANRNPPQSDSMFMIRIMKVKRHLPSFYLSCRLISDLRQSIRKRDGNRRRWIVSKHQSGQKTPIKCRCDWFVGRLCRPSLIMVALNVTKGNKHIEFLLCCVFGIFFMVVLVGQRTSNSICIQSMGSGRFSEFNRENTFQVW